MRITATLLKEIKEAGWSSLEIIQASKAGKLEEIVALVKEEA